MVANEIFSSIHSKPVAGVQYINPYKNSQDLFLIDPHKWVTIFPKASKLKGVRNA